MIKPFEPLLAPLSGSNLIEASAGTGKTYTISCLVVRAVAYGVPIEKILLVTFTKAACAELQQAVRDRLQEALQALPASCARQKSPARTASAATGTTFAQQLAAAVSEQERALMAHRLESASGTLDLANIFTIHGFCQRMLSKYAFESGVHFGFSVLEDERELLTEIVQDYWRISTYEAANELIGWLGAAKYSYQWLFAYATTLTRAPRMETPPAPKQPTDTEETIGALRDVFAAASLIWHKERDSLLNALLNAKLHQGYYSAERIAAAADAVAIFFAADFCLPQADLPEFFSTAKITKALTKASPALPQHPFLAAVDKLLKAMRAMDTATSGYGRYLARDFARYLHRELKNRKRERNLVAFSDMLTMLYEALDGKEGGALRDKIAKDFAIAFVDEFQDTDVVQCAIFRRLFGESALFVVGDPKQSIYAFRGANIAEYLRASQEADRRYFLEHNWRSSADYLEALNTLFSQKRNPFGNELICFHKLQSGSGANDALLIDGERKQPFSLWYLPASALSCPNRDIDTAMTKSTSLSKEAGRIAIAKAVAIEIARLCELGKSDRALIGTQALKPADIAVLVPKHHGASVMLRALNALGVPCVTRGGGNVFASRTAWELQILFNAIIHSTAPRYVRAALATTLMGYSASTIDLLANDDKWDRIGEQFSRYRSLWQNAGFGAMFGALLGEQKILVNLARSKQAERRLTDFWHIVELLSVAAISDKKSPSRLLRHLEEEIAASREAQRQEEATTIRLESDELAVQITTIHASKGLEYKIVFCPILWDVAKDNEQAAFLEEDGQEATPKARLRKAQFMEIMPKQPLRKASKRSMMKRAHRVGHPKRTRRRAARRAR